MAVETVELNDGSGGALVAVDTIGGTSYPTSKITVGADGVDGGFVSSDNPLPVGGSGAASLGKAEDAAHASGDVGVMALSVRKDTAAATSGTDGDYQPLTTDANGRLHAVLPSTTQGGATAKTSDYDTGAGTDTVPMQGIALPASGGAVAGGTSSNPLRTDPTGTTAQPVTDNGGSLTTDVPDGSDAALGAKADSAASSDTGTFSLIALFKRLLEKITAGLTVVGNVANRAADSGNPVKVAGVYHSTYSSLDNGQRAHLRVDDLGQLIITLQNSGLNPYVVSSGVIYQNTTAGSQALAVRNDGGGVLGTTGTGELTPFTTDSSGRLWTNAAVTAVPADPFGANADAAASAGGTGSISAKLRTISGDADAAKTALQIIDDWDESDRAKVNPIAGQAGVAAGAGSVGATTQRVTLASDDPAVVALQTLDNIVSGNEAQVDIVTQPARVATTDTITAKIATDAIQNGTTALTPKFAAINTATSGDQNLVAAVTSKKIRVLSLALIARGDVDAYLKSGGGTALFGGGTAALDLTTNGGFVLPFNPVGWFESASGEALVLNLSGAVGVAGSLTYVEV